MRTLVTGATGHVGGAVVRALLARGHEVRALVRDEAPALEGLDVARVRGDVLDPASLEGAFAGMDAGIHLAGLISVVGDPRGRVRAVNVEGTRHVLAAAAGRPLVAMSSIHAFRQEPLEEPLDETRPLADRPGDLAYDRAKSEAMRLALAAGAVVVAPTAVIGPHDHRPSRMGHVLLACFSGRLPAVVPGGFDWVDVRDVAEGTVAALERGRPGEAYLLGGAFATVRTLADLAADVAGVRAPGFTCPGWLAGAAAPFGLAWARLAGAEPILTPESIRVLATANPRISSDKARGALGWRPRPLRETLEDTCRWFRAAGRLPPEPA